MAFLSIVTPVYNRAEIIGKLFDSLERQTNKRFEWIVVDDGSTDDIDQKVEDMKKKSPDFDIVYLKKENGGKHTALNHAYPFIKGDHTLIVDSDDYIVENAVDIAYRMIASIADDAGFAGVSGNRGRKTADGKIEVLGRFPEGKNCIECTSMERPKYGLFGDKAEIFRTELLKKYPFPVFSGEKMIPESVVWNRIALEGYRLKWFPDILIITEYLPDGLSGQGMERRCKNNIHGYLYDCKITANNEGFPYGSIYKGYVFSQARKLGYSYKEISAEAGVSKLNVAAALMVNRCMDLYRRIRKRDLR